MLLVKVRRMRARFESASRYGQPRRDRGAARENEQVGGGIPRKSADGSRRGRWVDWWVRTLHQGWVKRTAAFPVVGSPLKSHGDTHGLGEASPLYLNGLLVAALAAARSYAGGGEVALQ